jgi:hypothetical protein
MELVLGVQDVMLRDHLGIIIDIDFTIEANYLSALWPDIWGRLVGTERTLLT